MEDELLDSLLDSVLRLTPCGPRRPHRYRSWKTKRKTKRMSGKPLPSQRPSRSELSLSLLKLLLELEEELVLSAFFTLDSCSEAWKGSSREGTSFVSLSLPESEDSASFSRSCLLRSRAWILYPSPGEV